MEVETKHYSDGTSATGVLPLPDLSPSQQDALDTPKYCPICDSAWNPKCPDGPCPAAESIDVLTVPAPIATPLFGDDDPRYGNLTDAILATIRERGRGLLLVGVLGSIRLVEEQIVRENCDEAHGA